MSRLPVLEWNYSAPLGYRGSNVNSVFRQWHRAHLLGLDVVHLKTGADEKAAADLQRLNLWISANGAWRCSLMPFWDAFNALDAQLGFTLGRSFGRVGCDRGGL